MRLSPVILLMCALAGVLGGGALIGLPALGGCLIFDSLCVGGYALFRDFAETRQPAAHPQPGRTLAEIFDKARAA